MRHPGLKLFAFLSATAVSAAVLVLPLLGRGEADAAPTPADGAGPLEAVLLPEGGAFKISKTPPDPPPMTERIQWVFDLRWDRGEIFLVAVHRQDMGEPHPTPRAMGRFALELFEGPTLIERVRFDFPMLGAGEVVEGGLQAPRFEPKLRTRIGVFFPATKRGTKLELWDRARDIRWPLPWPPKEGTLGPDASVD